MFYNVRRKVTETLINSKTIADAQVRDQTQSIRQHHALIRGPRVIARALRAMKQSQRQEVGKKIARGGQAEVEDEEERQRGEEREKGTRGKNQKRRGDKKTDGF